VASAQSGTLYVAKDTASWRNASASVPLIWAQTGIKNEVMRTLQDYVNERGLTQEDIAVRSGVNVAYINAMLQNKLLVGKAEIKIKDTYFKKVSDIIGFRYEAHYWDIVETVQYDLIMEELLDAKMRGIEKMIIGDTGTGKTYTVKRFCYKHPLHTYSITVSSMHTLADILDDISDRMGIQKEGRGLSKLRRISRKLHNLKLEGEKPVIIIDEAENLKLPALKMTKALYDAIEGYCPIVLVGTRQLVKKMERLREEDAEGMAQLYRRFKAGKREVRGINKETMFLPFLKRIEDEGVRSLACALADNYGELNKYVEPALRESDSMKEPLTEDFYRMLYKL
jgi:transcriptional regulator with XRE-family HTH domain